MKKIKQTVHKVEDNSQITENYNDIQINREEGGGLEKRHFSMSPKYVLFFSFTVLALTILYWLFLLFTRSANVDAYFVTDHTNTAMDYFNMLANINNIDPYHASANYPALCFVFFRIMHRFLQLPANGLYPDAYALRTDMVAQLGYILYIIVCLIIIWETIKYSCKGSMIEKVLFSTALFLSGPMIFLLERGNILLIVLACMLMFLVLYDSTSKTNRIIAYIFLAIAAALKIYPAVFGILVICKKRYKEAILLVIMGIMIFLVPFFAFDGIGSIKAMLAGLSAATEAQTGIGLGHNYSLDNLFKLVAAFAGKQVIVTPSWILGLGIFICFVLFIISKMEWQRLYALTLLCIWFPSFSYTYTLVLFFLPIISFFFRNEERSEKKFNIMYIVLFVFLLIPYALPLISRINEITNFGNLMLPVSWGTVIINCVLVLMAVLIFVENVCKKLRRSR